MTLGVTKEQKLFILETIRNYFPDCEVLAFGSRITEKYNSTSDLDLCIRSKNELSISNWAKLSADFVESDLPFKIDLLDWHRISPQFQELILKKHLAL